MRRAALFAFIVSASACRCGVPVTPVELGFRASTDPIDFGRVLEGSRAHRTLTISAETRVDVTIGVTATPEPTFEAPASVDLPGGGQVDLDLGFLGGNGPASGTLRLSVGNKAVSIELRGVGVRPLICLPTQACRVSSYSLEEDRCVETLAPDEAACDPGSLCLESGRCRSGECLGVARSCSDNNQCTVDGCSMETGCVYTPRSCPPPAELCHVATCDPTSGCGSALAVDGTPCGAIDCITANFCLGGVCRQFPTPDGVECASAIACLGRGECHNQKCVRPDAGEWLPSWSAVLDGTPSAAQPSLLSMDGNLFFTACGVSPALADGGDDGGLDGGEDGGEDAGLDGGRCALVSYTGTGFERFAARFDEGAPRRLVQVGPRGVVVLADDHLEVRSRSTGDTTSTLAASGVAPRAIASRSDGAILVAVPRDGGSSELLAWTDAGVASLAGLPFAAPLLALDEDDVAHLFDAPSGVLVRFDDGGLLAAAVDAGLDSLALAGGSVVSAATAVTLFFDGGSVLVPLDWASDAGPREPMGRPVLLDPDTLVVFFKQCETPLMSCPQAQEMTWVRAMDSRTGAPLWETQVLAAGAESELVEAALLDFAPVVRGAVATVVRADLLDAGVRAYLQVFGSGRRLILCPLPYESRQVKGALFSGDQLLVFTAHDDAGTALEAFPLNGLPLLGRGWPQADGVQGQRAATRF